MSQVRRRRRQLVVGLAGRVGAPGQDPPDLLAGDRGAEHGVADQLVRRGIGQHLVLDAHVTEDLHRALVGDVRPGRVRRPAVLRDHDVRTPRSDRNSAADDPAGPDPTSGRPCGPRSRRERRFGNPVIENNHCFPLVRPEGRKSAADGVGGLRPVPGCPGHCCRKGLPRGNTRLPQVRTATCWAVRCWLPARTWRASSPNVRFVPLCMSWS